MPSARASSSSSAAGGKLTKLESALYRAAQAAPGGIITQDQIEIQFKNEEVGDRLNAVNGLLRKSLLSAQSLGGTLQFSATAKAEASMMGKLDENETLVYSHIKDSRNEGIWTKQLKSRTNLHQTIINRCLKSLEQKQLVKAVKSVKYPTRKIFMLFGLTPSIELSGGPWYTDNELDTGFINELSMAILNFIRSKSFPKNGQSRALFPTTHTSQLPSANSIHSYLRNSNLTETELEVEHVVSLLDILVYDEQIEKIPILPISLGGSGGDINGFDEEDQDYSDSGRSTDGSGSDSSSGSASESESEAEESGSEAENGKRKVKKERKANGDDQSDEENEGPVTSGKRKRASAKSSSSSRKKSKSSKASSKSSKSKHRKSSTSRSRSSSRSRSRSRSRAASSDDEQSGSESDTSTASSSSDHASRRRSSSKKKRSNGKSSSSRRSLATGGDEISPFVYRAVRPHSVKVGWTETPCGHCPVFDFCDDTGPVNAETCQYYGGKHDELGRKLTNGWIDTVADNEGDEDGDDEDNVPSDGVKDEGV
ncbi:DNA-directed RNA polymerase III subunit RPC6 [Pseudozyma hubeiensis]|nr:DNA-directed RNA polymerase III subunit RPC6 [Pseudozyma hubeiensis]